MAKTDPIDPNVPAGSEDPKLGDNRIRELARAVVEVLRVEKYMGSDGGSGVGYNEAAAGQTEKTIFRAQASNPTAVASAILAFAKDVSGKAELHIKDEDGNVIQLTSAGILNSLNLAGNQTVAGVKTFSAQAAFTLGITAAAAIVSTLATGTAPFTVASTTKVTNLNVDQVDGKHIDSIFGSWASKSNNTVYQAASDGIVTAYSSGNNELLKGYTDGNNPPTTQVTFDASYTAIVGASATFPVRKGDYWKVTGATVVRWLPIGA